MNKIRRVYRFMDQLPKMIRIIHTKLDELDQKQNTSSQKVEKIVENINESLFEFGKHIESLENQQSDLRRSISSVPRPSSGKKTSHTSTTTLQANNHLLDGYYVAFENKFRGTEQEIYDRLKKSYSKLLNEIPSHIKKLPVVDVGCGRGELLRLYKELGFDGIGIDLNDAMVAHCKDKGFAAHQVDALAYLQTCEANSIGGISGIHFAEHVPFELLMEFLREAYRVVTKGGFVLLETPNPENLTVGAFSFWYDSSHQRPIPPDVLAFMMQYVGLGELKTLRMHPAKEKIAKLTPEITRELAQKIFGPRDYATIGFKFTARNRQISK